MKKLNLRLKDIEISRIQTNTNNPRGKFIREKDEQFPYLKRSIREFGLLVPLIVRKIKQEQYILLDGERRYRALKELGIKKVPAHVVTDKIDLNCSRNLMFHIHTNRADWDACQQCKALESLYQKLKEKYNNNENKIAKELIKLTGTNERTINDRLNFLRWPQAIKNMIYEKEPELYWTIVEIENGIIKPAEKNFPDYFKKVRKNEIRKLLLDKYLKHFVHASTEARKMRYIVKTTKKDPEMYKYAFKIFKKVIETTDYSFEDAREDFLARYPESAKIDQMSFTRLKTQLIKTATILSNYDVGYLNNAKKKQREEFEQALQDLQDSLDVFRRNIRNFFKNN